MGQFIETTKPVTPRAIAYGAGGWRRGLLGEAWLDSKRGFSVEALPWKNSSPALPRSLTLGRIMPAITRQDNSRHNLHELLLIALCTILTGGKDCSDMALFGTVKEPFLRQFLRLRHGIPSHDTFQPGVPTPRSGTVRSLLHALHATLRRNLAGRGGD